MISLPALVMLTLAAVVAAVATALALASGSSWPTALLTGGGASGAALAVLPHLLDHRDDQ